MNPGPPIANMVFRGGGVKGIGFAGTITRLEEVGLLQTVQRVAGSSAGAITAMLLSLGYKAKEIQNELANMKFPDFQDADSWMIGGAVVPEKARMLADALYSSKLGAYRGEVFKAWAGKMIAQKLGNPNATFADLQLAIANKTVPGLKQLFVTGTNLTTKSPAYFSHEHSPNMKIVDAARISMSFPLAFEAVEYEGEFYSDGGIANNFPIDLFEKPKYFSGPAQNTFDANPETIGVKVTNKADMQNFDSARIQNPKKRKFFETKQSSKQSTVVDSLVNFGKAIIKSMDHDGSAVKDYKNQIIEIYDEEVNTLDFNLTDEQKKQLIKSGKISTDICLLNRNLGPFPIDPDYTEKDLSIIYKSVQNKNKFLILLGKLVNEINFARQLGEEEKLRQLLLNLSALKESHKELFTPNDLKTINTQKFKGILVSSGLIEKIEKAMEEEFKDSAEYKRKQREQFLVVQLYQDLMARRTLVGPDANIKNTKDFYDQTKKIEKILEELRTYGKNIGYSPKSLTSNQPDIVLQPKEYQNLINNYKNAMSHPKKETEKASSPEEIEQSLRTIEGTIQDEKKKIQLLENLQFLNEACFNLFENLEESKNNKLFSIIENNMVKLREKKKEYDQLVLEIVILKNTKLMEVTEEIQKLLKDTRPELPAAVQSKKQETEEQIQTLESRSKTIESQVNQQKNELMTVLKEKRSQPMFSNDPSINQTLQETVLSCVNTQFENFKHKDRTIQITPFEIREAIQKQNQAYQKTIVEYSNKVKEQEKLHLQVKTVLHELPKGASLHDEIFQMINKVEKTLREKTSGTTIALTKKVYQGIEFANQNKGFFSTLFNVLKKGRLDTALRILPRALYQKLTTGSESYVKQLLDLKQALYALSHSDDLSKNNPGLTPEDIRSLPHKYGLDLDLLKAHNQSIKAHHTTRKVLTNSSKALMLSKNTQPDPSTPQPTPTDPQLQSPKLS